MSVPIDLVGQKYDRLTVVKQVGMTPSGARWLCQCDCGGMAIKLTSNLRDKRKKRLSCPSCWREVLSEGIVKHGGRRSNSVGTESLYQIWKSMRKRCANVSDKYYGGKGISVCAEWDDYAVFREWAICNGYIDIQNVTRGDRLSIERKNNALGYSPSNCEWITGRENTRRMAAAQRAKRQAA